MKLAFIFLVFAVFSTDEKETFPKSQSETGLQKQKQKRVQSPKILKSLISYIVESYLDPKDSSKMKMTDKQWRTFEPRMSKCFPNETSIKVYRDLRTNEISWEDENDLIPIDRKTAIGHCLQTHMENLDEMSSCFFDLMTASSCWYRCIPDEAKPFYHEILLAMSEFIVVERINNSYGYVTYVTPLTVAAIYDASKAVAKLIERGANLEKQSEITKLSTLHYAALYGGTSSCEVLLKHGANIDVQERTGTTPLIFAARSDRVATVKVLLAFGANTRITDVYGRTALENANYMNHQHCAAAIETHIAKLKGIRDDIIECRKRGRQRNKRKRSGHEEEE